MPTINTVISFDGHQTVALASTGAATYAELPAGFINIGDQIAYPSSVTFTEDGTVTPVLGQYTIYHVGSDGTITNLTLDDGALYDTEPSEFTVVYTLSPPSPLTNTTLTSLDDGYMYQSITSVTVQIGDQFWADPSQVQVTEDSIWSASSAGVYDVYHVASNGLIKQLVFDVNGLVEYEDDAPTPNGTISFQTATTTTTTISQPYTYSAQDFTGFEHRINSGSVVASTSPVLIDSLTPEQSVTIEARAVNQGLAGAWFSVQVVTDSEAVIPDSDPAITLSGGDVILFIGQPYAESGFSAVDGLGNDITDQVQVTNNHNPDAEGSYTVTYTVTVDGQTITETRNIFVIQQVVDAGQIMPRLQAIGYTVIAQAARMTAATNQINALIEAGAEYREAVINFRALNISSQNQEMVDNINQRLVTKGYTITETRTLLYGTMRFEIIKITW